MPRVPGPFPSDGCSSRNWIIRGEPHFVIEKGRPRLYIVPWETVDTLDKLMADDKWHDLGCGYAGDADSYISQTYNEKGEVQKGYFVPLSLSRLFAATPKRLTLHAQTSFTLCCPSTNFNGGWTEVRTATSHDTKARRVARRISSDRAGSSTAREA